MGSGCSSPFKRSKRSKNTARRCSSIYDPVQDADGQQPPGTDTSRRDEQCSPHNHRFIIENDNNLSENNGAELPSTLSVSNDHRTNLDEHTKTSEHSANNDFNARGQANSSSMSTNHSAVVARMMALDGGYMPQYDRHLLVSPALSPAPSTCYSPSPASSTSGSGVTACDLNDLNEAFKSLTFGLPHVESCRFIEQPERPTSELHNDYTHQLVQDYRQLMNSITVIFTSSEKLWTPLEDSTTANGALSLDILAEQIESNLRSLCDEHSFDLRFLNLTQSHLSSNFRTNNSVSLALETLQRELDNNGSHLAIIVLSNSVNQGKGSELPSGLDSAESVTTRGQLCSLDKKQLPKKIQAPIMNKLVELLDASHLDGKTICAAKDSLKRWYNQTGNLYLLRPIYQVYPKVLSEDGQERGNAWKSWNDESSTLVESIYNTQKSDSSLVAELDLRSVFSSCIDFILKESSLQKRTLLIRNHSQALGRTQSSSFTSQTKDASLNELMRVISDPNKLTIKKSLSNSDFIKTINDWISDNTNKFFESIQEAKILNGHYVPPFIDPKLFVELTCQRLQLERYIQNTVDNFESKAKDFYKNQISSLIDDVVDCAANDAAIVAGSETTSSSGDIDSSNQPRTNHLVFISGPKGCGKSTLLAQSIRYVVQKHLNKVQILYRFCGSSGDSRTSTRLLRNICEQFCQAHGENTMAASLIYSSRREIINALNRIIKSQPYLIFLDRLDLLGSANQLDWLCEITATPRLKIFITLETDSDLYKDALKSYTDATFISIDHPSPNEWTHLLAQSAKSFDLCSSSSCIYDCAKKVKLSDRLSYTDVHSIVRSSMIRKLNLEPRYLETNEGLLAQDSKGLMKELLSSLQILIAPVQVCSLLVVLNLSRDGLTETALTNIMSYLSTTKIYGLNSNPVISQTILNYLFVILEPWLTWTVCDKRCKVSLDKCFLNSAINHYTDNMFPNIVQEIAEQLIDYFGLQQARSKGSRGSQSELKEQLSSAETFKLAMKNSELINLLIQTHPTKARDLILSKQFFYSLFFYGNMPEEFIEDCEKLRSLLGRKSSTSTSGSSGDELEVLSNYIRKSIYPLRYSGTQIYSQLYCRAFEAIKSGKSLKGKKLNDIISSASCPPVRSLMPASDTSINSFIKTRIGPQPVTTQSGSNSGPGATSTSGNLLVHDDSQRLNTGSTYSNSRPLAGAAASSRQRIFTIKDNHRHVIVTHPDKNILCVWDIYEERPVRTIANIDQPRDLRMIDQKRAVILCNRELKVYDLDSGNMLIKLKGVMNQKMPFFEVFGDNYVIALARNRMYVNMLNISTGELETTFKVGEDRFLNSLLVSANGGVCVCGDETQKPFPLLVWNLNERRLMYDLRLDRHEFITKMSAISDDGHFVVSVCRQLGQDGSSASGMDNHQQQQQHQATQHHSNTSAATGSSNQQAHKSSPNFIVIYDLNSGTLFKKWKPGLDSCSVAISVSPNRSGKVINTLIDSSILVWDLASGTRRHTLLGHTAPPDVLKVQNSNLFSMNSACKDQSLRIWDIEEGCCLAVFSPDAPVSCCQISYRGDALICGFASETRLSTLIMCKNETVSDVVKRNKRRKSSRSIYIFDEPQSRKSSS